MTLQMKYNEFLREGKEEGRKEGRKEGEFTIISKLVDQGIISLEDGIKSLGVSVEEYEETLKKLNSDYSLSEAAGNEVD